MIILKVGTVQLHRLSWGKANHMEESSFEHIKHFVQNTRFHQGFSMFLFYSSKSLCMLGFKGISCFIKTEQLLVNKWRSK